MALGLLGDRAWLMAGLSVRPPVVLGLCGELFNDDTSERRRPGEVFGAKTGVDLVPSPFRERRLPVVEVLATCGRAIPILILDSGTLLLVEGAAFLFFSMPDLKDVEDDDDCPETKDLLAGCAVAVGKLLDLGRGIALRLTSDLGFGDTT